MYRTIMVPLDGSPLGEYALPFALDLAQRVGATVDLVHVCTSLGPNAFGGELDAPVLGETRHEQLRARAHAYLDQLGKNLGSRWDVEIMITLLDGRAVDMLYDHARASGAELVVMTTHGYGPLSRTWMGNVADNLMRRLPMPVLMVRPQTQVTESHDVVPESLFKHVLIPLDGSALAEEILVPALALGTLMQAEYTLMMALEQPALGYPLAPQVVAQWNTEALAYLEHVATRLRARGLVVHTYVIVAPPAIAIIDTAREHTADLIALSTHGRGGLVRMLLGSVADKVVRGAGVPVLLQRPRGEVVPLDAVADPVEAIHAQ